MHFRGLFGVLFIFSLLSRSERRARYGLRTGTSADFFQFQNKPSNFAKMNFDGNFTPNPQPLEFQTICQEVKNEFEDSGTGFRIPNPQEDPELIEELESLLPFDSPSHDNNSQILDLSQSMNSQFFDTTQFVGTFGTNG